MSPKAPIHSKGGTNNQNRKFWGVSGNSDRGDNPISRVPYWSLVRCLWKLSGCTHVFDFMVQSRGRRTSFTGHSLQSLYRYNPCTDITDDGVERPRKLFSCSLQYTRAACVCAHTLLLGSIGSPINRVLIIGCSHLVTPLNPLKPFILIILGAFWVYQSASLRHA